MGRSATAVEWFANQEGGELLREVIELLLPALPWAVDDVGGEKGAILEVFPLGSSEDRGERLLLAVDGRLLKVFPSGSSYGEKQPVEGGGVVELSPEEAVRAFGLEAILEGVARLLEKKNEEWRRRREETASLLEAIRRARATLPSPEEGEV